MGTFEKRVISVSLGILVLLVLLLFLLFYDALYIIPIASDNANKHCKLLGFDQYNSFSRVGLFSEEPIAIKCEYVEKSKLVHYWDLKDVFINNVQKY